MSKIGGGQKIGMGALIVVFGLVPAIYLLSGLMANSGAHLNLAVPAIISGKPTCQSLARTAWVHLKGEDLPADDGTAFRAVFVKAHYDRLACEGDVVVWYVHGLNDLFALGGEGAQKDLRETAAPFIKAGVAKGMIVKDTETGKVLASTLTPQTLPATRATPAPQGSQAPQVPGPVKAANVEDEDIGADTPAMQQALSVTVVNKVFDPKNYDAGQYSDWIGFKYQFQNTGPKDIHAFQGHVIVRDIFGDKIVGITIKFDEGLKVGQTKLETLGHDYNQFSDIDQKINETALGNLKIEWVPVTVLFADGTKLGK
jgi:hypothetical protein